MGRITAWELLSLDGVMETPQEWAAAYQNEEMAADSASRRPDAGALLLGRVTYEELAAHWPTQPAGDPMADYVNEVRKFVVSTTLEEPLAWTNSTLVGGNVVEEIAALKGADRDLGVIGSGVLVRSLLREGLLDELTVLIHPLVLGTGKRLFVDGTERVDLDLVDSRTFGTGVVSHTYRPAGTDAGE